MTRPSWMRVTSALFISGTLLATGCAPAMNHTRQAEEQEGENAPIPALTPTEKAEIDAMREPALDAVQESAVLSRYAHVDPKHEIPDNLLKTALAYYDANLSRIPNKNYLTVVDFKPSSKYARLFVITMSTGAVWHMHVAHGSGSDPGRTGYATRFSNTPGSNMSSLGFYRTAGIYSGKHGASLRLDGLSSTNSNVRARAVVMHSAAYVSESNVVQGRSNGCLAVTQANKDRLINMIDAGSIIYAGLGQ